MARIWHGWTTVENADAYQAIAEGEVFPATLEREIPGLVGAHLMRSDVVENGEVEFTTIIWLESLDNVKGFMGEDYRRAHVPENAGAVLKRFDSEAKHGAAFRDGDWSTALTWPATAGVAALGAVQLVAIPRYLDVPDWGSPQTWVYLAVLASFIVVGVVGLQPKQHPEPIEASA